MSYRASPEAPIGDHQKNQDRVVNLLPFVASVELAFVEVPGEYLECLSYLVAPVVLGHLRIGLPEALLLVAKLVVDWKSKRAAGFVLLLLSLG